uniref:Glutaredoxin domain-containing protein n=1 Tax=viral metagenome TaxID=1070528 RepID=A0A6C0IEV9_9ZZZZ
MSSILYYSNYCEHSKKLLQTLSKSNVGKEIHFICIDKRTKDANNKIFIVLENGQKIIMPENVNRVPALLLLNQGFNVLYGESILQHLKPKQEEQVKQATFNNLEPSAFSFGSGMSNIVSDNYSFLDMDSESLSAKGSGGIRQMHNYVDLNYSDQISTPADETEYKNSNRLPEGLTVEQLQQQRDQELNKINGRTPPGYNK